MSREKTTEESRKEFLSHVASLVDYWDKVESDKKKAMEGVVFSIMSVLDGCSMALPGFIVAPCTNEEDKDYYKGKGENYYPL